MNNHQPIVVDSTCDDIESFAQDKYAPECAKLAKSKDEFRVYSALNKRVSDFYKDNHINQTLEFVLKKKNQYEPLGKMVMGIWEAMEYLNQLVDESDPDTQLNQIEHLLQSAEALRKDKCPDWMILTGLIHDLGKVLILFNEPQVGKKNQNNDFKI